MPPPPPPPYPDHKFQSEWRPAQTQTQTAPAPCKRSISTTEIAPKQVGNDVNGLKRTCSHDEGNNAKIVTPVLVDLEKEEVAALNMQRRRHDHDEDEDRVRITVAKWARLTDSSTLNLSNNDVAERQDDEESIGPLNLSTSSSNASDVQEANDLVDTRLNLESANNNRDVKESLCYHKESASLPAISLVDHAADQAKLAKLRESLTGLLVALLGEDRLEEMGFPDKDILAILK